MSMTTDNPRGVIGNNAAPDYAKMETERLVVDYGPWVKKLQDLEAEFGRAPEHIDDDRTALRVGGLIKRFRDLREQLKNFRVIEKEPHLRRGNADDAFFNGHMKTIQPEEKSERRTSPGKIDVLQGRINVYQDGKEAAERERLAIEAAETARIARVAQDNADRERRETDRLRQEAEDRRLEAERARAPAQIEKKGEVAVQASLAHGEQTGAAIGAEVHANTATEAARDAHIATLAKSADIVRTRGVTEDGAGVTLTKAKESYAYVTDRDQLDKNKLWNSLTDDQVKMALGKWARATGHNEKMAGAEIGWRTKGVTR